MTTKRDIFTELTEGFDALKAGREGKFTLHTAKVDRKPAPSPGCAADPHGVAQSLDMVQRLAAI